MSLEKGKAEKRNTFTFTDIFESKKDENDDKCHRITSLAKTKLGKKYVWGASGNKNTYDCSSFVKYVYKKNGIELPRTSIMQSKVGKYVKRDELQKGDLIFFDTSKRRKGYVNHVGIYLGDNKFIHASSAKKKVVITSLNKNFYSNRYKGARRPS
jgi:cell wall-associated NlpC family hydrolase